MIEVVMSLALFGVTMLMITVLLATASRIYTKNYRQELQFEKQVNALNYGDVDSVSNEDIWQFTYQGIDETGNEVSMQVGFRTKLFKANDTNNNVQLLKFKLIE